MFVIVPVIDGVPQVGNRKLYEARSISEDQAIAYLEGELGEGWTELTETEYLSYWEPGKELPGKQLAVDPIAEIKEQNLILMDALATVYEELLLLKEGGA